MRGYDIVALLVQIDHTRQKFRRVLEIRIHNDYGVAVCKVQTGGHCGLMAEVPTEAKDLDALIFLGGSFENVGPRARNYLASVFSETAMPTGWDPDPDGTVDTICLDPSGATLYAGGEFSQVGRATRDAAEFDTAAGFLLGWRPTAPFTAEACSTSLDGSALYLGGDGAFDVYR